MNQFTLFDPASQDPFRFTTNTKTPFVPSARPGGRIEGPAPDSPPVILSAAKNLASHLLKQCNVRWRACLDPPEALTKFFAYGELLLVYSDKK